VNVNFARALSAVLLSGLVGTALSLTGCAQKFKLVPREAPGQVEVIFVRGEQAAMIQGAGVSATIQGRKGLEGKLEIEVLVKNLSAPRVDVLPEKMQLMCWDGKQEHPMTYWRPQDLISRKRFSQGSMALATALFNGIAMGGDDVKKQAKLSKAERRRLQEAAERRQREIERETQETKERHARELRQLDQALLKATTLRPGESVRGSLLFEFRDGEAYRLALPLGGRTYYVQLVVARN